MLKTLKFDLVAICFLYLIFTIITGQAHEKAREIERTGKTRMQTEKETEIEMLTCEKDWNKKRDGVFELGLLIV